MEVYSRNTKYRAIESESSSHEEMEETPSFVIQRIGEGQKTVSE